MYEKAYSLSLDDLFRNRLARNLEAVSLGILLDLPSSGNPDQAYSREALRDNVAAENSLSRRVQHNPVVGEYVVSGYPSNCR